jgi:long-chain acyl-CoA synthetase
MFSVEAESFTPSFMDFKLCNFSIKYRFYCGDATKLKDDMAFVKPHLLLGVPKIFHRIADNVNKRFDNLDGLSRKLVRWGLEKKLEELEKTGNYESCVFDTLVFSAVKKSFGGRVKFMISGGAPIKPETYQFMKVITSCPMAEGYGLTEASLMICFQTPDNAKTGHLGKLLVIFNLFQNTWELKLADIP